VQQRADQRRRAMTVLGSVVVLAVVAVVIAVIVINRPTKNDPSGNRVNAASSILSQAGAVTNATYTTVGEGKSALPVKVTGEPPLTSGGKPEMLYVGAEFCPFCAIERWAMYESLSKFGTFSNVGEVRSATDDGNYASLDFYKSSFSSKYLTFTPVENVDRNHNLLQNVTTAQNNLWKTFSDKYGDKQQGYPFIDFGNKFTYVSAPLDPTVLGTLNQAQIAAQLNNPKSKVAQAIDGGANDITAAICSMTNNQPSNVCSSTTIKSLQTKLNG
jgi:hypothetical protein